MITTHALSIDRHNLNVTISCFLEALRVVLYELMELRFIPTIWVIGA
jgi:hypothetical protein